LYRVGAASVGLLAGLILGCFAAFASFLVVHKGFSASWVFGTSFAMAAVCFIWPPLAFRAMLGVAHFLFGVGQGISAEAAALVEPAESRSERWLRAIFWLGMCIGIAALAVLRLR
jgi:hypothetical protein